MAQEVPYITIKKNIHAKTSNIDNLVQQQRNLGFPIMKKPPVQEYITIPFPDFCTIFYEITIWTQFESQMNEVIEKIFYNYDHLDSFVMYSEYDNETKKGNGSRFVGFRDGSVTPQSNTEDFSDKERVIKYTYTIKVPTYLILDPKDETLAYGRKHGDSKTDDNSKYVYKSQNPVSVQLKEELVSSQVVEALDSVGVDVFGNQAQQDQERQNLFNLLSSPQGGGGGGGTSPTFDSTTPQPIAIVGSPGISGKLVNSDHVHAHGNLPGGTLHDTVSILSSGFAPSLAAASTGYVLTFDGANPAWLAPGAVSASAGGPVTGSDNFFVKQILQVSGSIVNPVGHLILSSSAGSKITVSGSLIVTDTNSLITRGKLYNDKNDLIISASTSRTIVSSSIIIPKGGGTHLSGSGIGIGIDPPYESIHVVDGNIRIEGSGTDLSYIIKNYGLPLYPQFRIGSVILGGDGDPEIRFIYSDLSSSERSVFEFDKKGIVASVKTGYGSHFEGFISGEVNPLFRLNSFPSMSLELGSGSDSWTDVILRRYDQGRLKILSQLSGGTAVTGNLDVANIYSSDGHLHLSSTFGTVAVSGNLKVMGSITGFNVVNTLNQFTGNLTINAGTNIVVTSGSGFITIGAIASTGTVFADDRYVLTSSLTSSVINVGDRRYTLTSSYDSFTGSINAFTASQTTTNNTQATLNVGLNGFTASFSASVQSIGDLRYTSLTSFIPFTGTVNTFTQSINSFTASHNTFSQSVNSFSASQLVLNAVLNGFTASFTASVQSIGDIRYVSLTSFNTFSSSVNTFTASQITTNNSQATLNTALNTFSASHNTFSQSINGFTASFTSSVQSIGDIRYANLATYGTFSASQNIFSSSVNSFTASINTLTQSLNGFTSSFSSSVQFIGDRRYISTINGYTGSIQILAGPNITVNSGSGFIMITGSAGGGGAITGSDNFFVKQVLQVSGSIINPVGDLILSSSVIEVSGNLKVTGQAYSANLFTVLTTGSVVTVNFNSGSSWIIDLSGSASDVTASLTNMWPGSAYTIKAIQGPVYRNLIFSGTGLGISGTRYPNSGSVPTMTSGNLAEDIYTIWFDGKRPYVTYIQNWM